MTAIWRIIAFGALLFLLGCGPRIDLEGRWVGKRNIATQPDADPAVVNSLSKVEVRIQRGRFTLFESGLPKTGNVRYSGDRALLEITEIMGQKPPEGTAAIELIPQGDGTLIYRDPGVSEDPVVLTRESQPGS